MMTDAMPKSSRKRERRQLNHDFSLHKDRDDFGASTSSETATVPLHRGYGTYFVHLWVGSPIPQRQTVIVDTASHLTAIACQETIRGRRNGRRRRRTGQQPHFFQPDQSQTFAAANCPHECLEDWSATNDNMSAETSCGVPSGGQESSPRQCQWTQSYAEGSSWKAYQAQDMVYLAGPDLLDAAHPLERHLAIPLRFGCLQEVSLQFSNQYADGILGLAAHSGQHSAIVAPPSSAAATSIGTTSLMPALFLPHGKISAPIFSLCIQKGHSYGINRGVGGMAGRMSIGGVPPDTNDDGTLVYAQNIQPSGFYTLQVETISIRSSQEQMPDLSIQIPSETINVFLNKGKGLIVDSGTTDTYLNEHLLPYFNEAWREVTGHAYKNKASPIKLTPEQIQGLPTIWIKCKEARYQDKSTNEAAVWSITSDQYLGYDDTTQLYTPRLFFTASRGGVLGSNSMEGLDVVFDLQHSRIGWIPSSCDYSGREQRPGDLPASEGFLSSDTVPYGSSQEIDPCLVPYQIFAMLVVQSSSTDEAVSQWDDKGIEDFRRTMFEVAHLPQFSSLGARQQLFALDHLNVTVMDISNTQTTILVEIAIMVNESNGLDQRHLSFSSQRTAMHRTQLQNVRTNRTKASRLCDPFEMFPLARASIEIADGIFKNPGFGDMLAESAPKLSSVTVSTTWIEGIQLYDDPFFEVDHLRDFSRLLHASLIISIFFFVISLLSLVLGERYRSRGSLMYLSRLRTFGDSDPSYEKLKEMEDVDDGEVFFYGDDELASAQAARLGSVATKRHTAARSAPFNTSR